MAVLFQSVLRLTPNNLEEQPAFVIDFLKRVAALSSNLYGQSFLRLSRNAATGKT